MGCGSSKGKEDKQSDDIEFKATNVTSMDEFFDKCRDIVSGFKDTVTPFDEYKDSFYEVTGFYEIPGASKCFVDQLTL